MELSTQTWREIFIISIFPLAYFEAASSPYKGIWLNHLLGLMHWALLKNLYHKAIHHFRIEKGTGAELCPASVFGIVTGDARVCYWLIVSLFLVTVPEFFAKVNSS